MSDAMTATIAMPTPARAPTAAVGAALRAFVAKGKEIRLSPLWKRAFAGKRKDHRYYDIVEDTMHPEITHRYLMITDQVSQHGSVQPFFVTSIDMAEGVTGTAKSWIDAIRRVWTGFLRTRVLMVGCVAGEGVLDGDPAWQMQCIPLLKDALVEEAYKLGAGLIVFKEFRASHRAVLDRLQEHGFARVPSMPMTRLNFDFASFDEYMSKKLSYATRKNLRRKFKSIGAEAPIELTVSTNIEAEVDELYPLYLQIYERSSMHFEKLTPEFLVQLGRTMPDKVRYFVWRQHGRPVAFSICTIDGDTICDEYIGIDYQLSVSSGLYHYTFRDIVNWALGQGLKAYASTGLCYDPKLHLKQELVPLDLYVRHRSGLGNLVMKHVVRWLDPTRHDKTLAEFPNYADL